jgi:hypothetical protein
MPSIIYVKNARAIRDFIVEVEFSNGATKTVDLGPFLRGPIFEPIRSSSDVFRNFKVDDELGTIVWENGADIDPEVLYGKYMPAWMEEKLEKAT